MLGTFQKATTAMNDNNRIATLKKYALLDTPQDSALDRIVKTAAKILNSPYAAISLVDRDRIWLKSSYGLESSEMALENGLCASAIQGNAIYVVEDARNDPRTINNSLVKGAFGLQFYAAVPLTVENGENIGTLFIVDKEPRTLSVTEQELLKDLGALVVDQFEAKYSVHQCAFHQNEMSNMLQSIYESTQETSTFMDKNLIIGYFNQAAKNLSNKLYGREVQIGDCFLDYILPEFQKPFMKSFKRAMRGKRVDLEKTNGTTWWRIAIYPVYDKNNTIVGVAYNNTDITEEKNNLLKLVQQNQVLKEIAWQQCHEVRGPVANILGFCHLLKDRASHTFEEQQDYITHLQDATQQLDKIIHKIVGQSVQRYKEA